MSISAATTERNARVSEIINDLKAKVNDASYAIDESQYHDSLNQVFDTDSWGFREILLVVVVARKLDSTYSASTALYSCKPRAIFEGPIKDFLIENNIPHRQSGPLNIAKGTPGLTAIWAEGRRPVSAANETVAIVNRIETHDDIFTDEFGVALLRRLFNKQVDLLIFQLLLSRLKTLSIYFGYAQN